MHVPVMRKPSFAGYTGGERIPLAAYAALLGVWSLSVGGFVVAMRDRLRAPRLFDVALIGVATHEIAQTLTHAWVAAPVRAPFTRYLGTESGEPDEIPRGEGLRYAIGNLLTCPFCVGPWVAGALLAGHLVAPLPTRFVTSIFVATALSNYLNRARAVAAGKARIASGEAKLVKDAVERAEMNSPSRASGETE
jgi:hypothetical protein